MISLSPNLSHGLPPRHKISKWSLSAEELRTTAPMLLVELYYGEVSL